MSDPVFSKPAPKSFTRMVGAQRCDPTPRAVLRLDQAGKDMAARTIAHPIKGPAALENPGLEHLVRRP